MTWPESVPKGPKVRECLDWCDDELVAVPGSVVVHALAECAEVIEQLNQQVDYLWTQFEFDPANDTRLVDAVKQVERLEGMLREWVRREGFPSAPCPFCGYNGRGYHQPDSHPCLRRFAEQKAADATG